MSQQQAQTIVVLGASGNIGKQLVPLLLTKGQRVRAVARHADKLTTGAEARVGDIEDVVFLTEVMRGADAVFAMIPPDYTAPDFRAMQNRVGTAIAQAIKASGIRRVVNLSSVGGHLPEGTGPILGLHDQEKRLDALHGLSLTHLRPSYFMENVFFGAELIKHQGIYGSPIQADVAFSQIATRDIAARAAIELLQPTRTGRHVVELLGPADISMTQVTRSLAKLLAKPSLSYVTFPAAAAEDAMQQAGMSLSAARAMNELYAAVNSGRLQAEKGRTQDSTTSTNFEAFADTIKAALV